MTPKVNIKIEQIARMRVHGGISDGRIAELLGLTRSGLSRILSLPEYIQAEQCILQGVTSGMDEALAGKAEEMKKVFSVGVPAAMRTLLETVTQRRDLRAAMEAAKEILDRDPDHTFTKLKDMPADAGMPTYQIPGAMLDNAAQDAAKIAAEIAVASAKSKTTVN